MEHHSIKPGRLRLVLTIIGFAFLALMVRSVQLHLFPSEKLQSFSKNQYKRVVEITPARGHILDRNNNALALSIQKPSIYINPKSISLSKKQIQEISKILGIPTKKLSKKFSSNSFFQWIKRQISQRELSELKRLKIDALKVMPENSRFYPLENSASQTLGFVGIDNKGLGGIELMYEKYLGGSPSTFTPLVDAKGKQILMDTSLADPSKPAHTLRLTIDTAIQSITYDAIEEGVEAAKADSGYAIVLDPYSGHILAMAGSPSFNPNNLKYYDAKSSKNRVLLDVFEPGSVTKPVVVASALDEKLIRAGQIHHCEKSGRLKIQGGAIHDDHPHEKLNTKEVIVYSSNICSYKIAKLLGRDKLVQQLQKFGFSNKAIHLGFPGESNGIISNPDKWREIRFANHAFGQGFSTTGLEVASMYGSIANGGFLMKPYLVSEILSSNGDIVLKNSPAILNRTHFESTNTLLKQALHEVTIDGTGKNAQTENYLVAGKTGTAQVFDTKTKSYPPEIRIVSFAGFAPLKNPRLVVYVQINRPRKKPYYGGVWAAPVFSKIMQQSLTYLNVEPDKLPPAIDAEKNMKLAKPKIKAAKKEM